MAECLLRPLATLRRRCRLYMGLEGAVHVAVAVLIGIVVQFVLDRWLRLAVSQRAVLTIVAMAAWCWVAARQLVWRLL
ncbi:MAG: hypothetical protein JXO22_16760, partial [Phycisphaerae bacterium]|nr:hypothetical protein [Phycisphaerae bacterium]